MFTITVQVIMVLYDETIEQTVLLATFISFFPLTRCYISHNDFAH